MGFNFSEESLKRDLAWFEDKYKNLLKSDLCAGDNKDIFTYVKLRGFRCLIDIYLKLPASDTDNREFLEGQIENYFIYLS